jgi:glycosyltransferase involved in cell wall biosynthesis
MNAWPHYLLSHSSDYYANTEVASMRNDYPDMEFGIVDSQFAAAVANARILLIRAVGACPGLHWEWLALRPLFYLRSMTFLPQSWLAKTRPDVIYAHGQLPWISRDCRIPMIGVEHFPSDRHLEMAGAIKLKRLDIEAKRWSTSRASALITNTPTSKARFEEYIPESRGRVRQIPAYTPYLEPIDEDAVALKHAEEDRLRVLFIGGEARRKGLPQLLEAIDRLDPRIGKELDLTVVSRFRDGAVDNVHARARVMENISTEDLLQLMRNAHIFAFPTQFESYGRVILEAMAAGCAVVTTNADPQDWMLDYGKAGISVDPASPPEIAEALTRLVDEASLRKAYGLAAVRRFKSVFYHRVVARQLRQVFEQVTKNAC